MNNLSRVAIIAIAIALAICVVPAAQAATKPSDTQMLLGIINKGEGVESAFIRQFAADPVAYGFSGKQDDAKVHQWAGRQAHLLAIKTGYYDWKFGAEVRVKYSEKATMAFVIQKDDKGNLSVVEYAVTIPSATPTYSQGATYIASATVGASNFFGASPVTGNKLPVPDSEYVCFPGE
jgi:hypothetical protein